MFTLDSADDKEDNFYPFSFSSPSLAYTCFSVSGAGQIMYYLVDLLGSHLTLRSLPIKSFQSGCNLKRLQEWLVIFLLLLSLRYFSCSMVKTKSVNRCFTANTDWFINKANITTKYTDWFIDGIYTHSDRFKHMQQIAVKEDKHKKEIVLISVNRKHPDYSSFKPEKKKAEISESSGDRSTAQAQSDKMLEIVEVYKPSIHNSTIFASVGEDKGRLYTASEASDVVFRYIEKENLVKPTNRSMVVLDPILCDALFKGAIKKGSAYPSEIHKKDVGSTFVGRMQPNHVVMRGGGEPVVRKGAVKPVQIMTERRQGNKKVTKVSGIETFLIDPDSFGSELQKKFACSTSVGELPGNDHMNLFFCLFLCVCE